MSGERPERESRHRVSLEQPVRLRFRLFQEFIEEVSSNISLGGMFIATEDTQEPESRFDFEMALEDGFTLIEGKGEVVWVRHRAEGPDRPAGMGVRFVGLGETSRVLISKIVDKEIRHGRPVFDVERQETARAEPSRSPASPEADRVERIVEEVRRTAARSLPALELDSAAGNDVRSTERGETKEGASDEKGPSWGRTRRYALAGVVGVVGGLLAVWLFHALIVKPRIEELESRIAGLATVVTARPKEPVTKIEEAEVDVEAAPGELPEPLDVVREWALAWSEKRIDDYLSFYASSFQPFGGMSRQAWEDLRRQRIERHAWIQVQVMLAQRRLTGDNESEVSFVQAYRSDGYHDRVKKVIRLVVEEGRWRIVEEEVVRALRD